MLSRVADNLYWLSRYLERAEHTARLADVHLNMTPDHTGEGAARRRQRVLECLHMPNPDLGYLDDYHFVEYLCFDPGNKGSLVSSIAAARENARQIREEVSSEMWQQINELYLFVRGANMEKIWAEQPHSFLRSIKQGAHLFQGLTDSTMSHGEGWQFIQVGRYLERALATSTLVGVEYRALALDAEGHATENYLDWIGVLKGCTAFEAYCKVYTAQIEPRQIAEFLLLNSEFPHSICFAVDCIQSALDAIADMTDSNRNTRVYRLSGRLRATLNYGQVDEIIAGGLSHYVADLQQQCAEIHSGLFQMYITYPIEEKLVA